MLQAELSGDKRRINLVINADLSTDDLESLISDLALLRGQMEPEVTRTCPNKETAGEVKVSIQDDPDFSLRLLKDGRIRLWIRNRGLGWLVFNLPVINACAMRDYLVANTPDDDPSGDFFREDFGSEGVSH